ncbi:ABC-F family ATP-binding cassette domain-containing protein [Desulfopila inferna]|uniref:ABC-F family ATP-binding cassette domain-containing protein n=1 Tax=Desulfopila inferna TaxID=468528 RepID=UPI0019638665|nr:ABC-F family ATP-binding cassette domain-containing protein [Desulfopila inferna]MBM9603439.1 ABC-F family ATP-binding cassette domain-containing protein [Desulfopila inferna]
MSNLLTCRSLSKSFGAQTLFQGIDLVVNSGERIGLIGPNGSGKSTLLKILSGLEEPDEGVILKSKHLLVGYLAQADIFDEEQSVFDNLCQSLSASGMDETEIQNRVQAILSRTEFIDDTQAVKLLSGGWRKRLAICRVLLASPQVVVLDEPTNHLDIEGILWLEKIIGGGLVNGPEAFVIVSHDRQFLENCATRMVELSAVYPQGSFQVDGNYSSFLEKRELFLEQQLDAEERLSNKMRRETEWLSRGPKARATKARYRIEEAGRLQDELALVRDRNRSTSNVRIDFGGTGRKTKKLLEATRLSKSFGNRVLFENLDILLSPGSRLGLLGRNGCGKSTLMEALAAAGNQKDVKLDSGEIKVAEKVKIVTFEQNRESLDPGISLRRALAPQGDSVVFRERSVHVVSWAKRFLFRPDQLETPVGELSGGEQARILIASLMLQPADILLLDEPTNDLDIGSLDVLEESLMDFPGALVLVTHDRYLLDRVCGSVIGFDGEGGTAYFADYQQWLTYLQEQQVGKQQESALKPEKEKPRQERRKAGKLSYLDQREFERMEGKIEEKEGRQKQLQEKINSPKVAADPQKLQGYWQELEKVEEEIEKMYTRWSELEEKKLSS